MNTNTSPIDFTLFDREEISEVPLETLQIFTRKMLRARDYIRTHWIRLAAQNNVLAKKIRHLFFDHWVTMYVHEMEEMNDINQTPRHLMERLLLAFYDAILLIDRYRDPFTFIPDSF